MKTIAEWAAAAIIRNKDSYEVGINELAWLITQVRNEALEEAAKHFEAYIKMSTEGRLTAFDFVVDELRRMKNHP